MAHTTPKPHSPSSDELLHSLDVLTRHRDSSVVRFSALQALLSLVRPDSARFYDVVKKGEQYRVVLSAWSEGGKLHFNDEALLDERFESVDTNSVQGKAIREKGGCHCSMSDGGYECCIPVLMNDEPVSLFEIRSREPFSDEVMGIATGVVAVYRNYLALLEDSQRDSLTGLLNRKTFDEGFSIFLTAAIRSDEAARENHHDRRSHKDDSHWLAVMDIDHFKRVNDTFGHLYGDEVLILMANLMRSSFRQGDRLYRFGGEEFVVLMRDVNFVDARRRLDAFREKVEQHEFPQVGQVTISIGFTSVSSVSMPTEVLGDADQALYYAKEHGRNQVCCYGELVEQNLLSKKTVHTEAEFF